jgi:hypothetical protein
MDSVRNNPLQTPDLQLVCDPLKILMMSNHTNTRLALLLALAYCFGINADKPAPQETVDKSNKKQKAKVQHDSKTKKEPEEKVRVRELMAKLATRPTSDDLDVVVAEGVRSSGAPIPITRAELDEAQVMLRQANHSLTPEQLLSEAKLGVIRQAVCLEVISKECPTLQENPRSQAKLKRMARMIERHVVIEDYVESKLCTALKNDLVLLDKLCAEEQRRKENGQCYRVAMVVFTNLAKAEQCATNAQQIGIDHYLNRQESRDNETKFNEAYAALLRRYGYNLNKPLLVDGNVDAMVRRDGYIAPDTIYMPPAFWEAIKPTKAGDVCGPVEVVFGDVKYFVVVKVLAVKPYEIEESVVNQVSRAYVLEKLRESVEQRVQEVKIVDKQLTSAL